MHWRMCGDGRRTFWRRFVHWKMCGWIVVLTTGQQTVSYFCFYLSKFFHLSFIFLPTSFHFQIYLILCLKSLQSKFSIRNYVYKMCLWLAMRTSSTQLIFHSSLVSNSLIGQLGVCILVISSSGCCGWSIQPSYMSVHRIVPSITFQMEQTTNFNQQIYTILAIPLPFYTFTFYICKLSVLKCHQLHFK